MLYDNDDPNTLTVTIAGAGTWVEVDGLSDGVLEGFTHSDGDLTVGNSADYLVFSGFSVSGAANDEMEAGISVNDTIQTKCRARRKIGAGGDVGRGALSCALTLTATDVVKLEMRNLTDTSDIEIELANVMVHQR
jgi:hypothetical protein